MISRLTAFAATFAILATATLSYATAVHQAVVAAPPVAAKQVRIIELQRVVVTAKRLDAGNR